MKDILTYNKDLLCCLSITLLPEGQIFKLLSKIT